MAESVVTFLLEKLSELITREASLLSGVDEQINSLRNELRWIRSFLKDADGKRKESERAKVWVDQVRTIAYDAEDVIDEFILKVERQRQRPVVIGSLTSCVGSTKQLKILHDVGNQIEKIKRRLEEISTNRLKYGIESIQQGEPSSSSNQRWSCKRRTPLVEEVDVVGIEDAANTLVTQLMEGDARFSVVSIVGMGGLGKTTLAKKVFNNSDVSRHFTSHAWTYVSQEYRVREILEGIINQITELKEGEKEKLGKMNEDELSKELFEYLKGRSYLVVVDDIWSIEAWDSLKAAFPDEMRGSKIMLTTRNKEVALYADVGSIPYELQFLRDDECWDLFCKKVLPRNVATTGLSPDLEKMGRDMMAKCGGLPLAVVVLGGLLSRKVKIPSEWAKVLKRINWQLGDGQNQISKILSLSYNDLPYYLKSCFLYFGVFPEDSEIHARKLFQLWLAEGLIQQRGDETMEEVAEDYLEELINRSLVQVSRRKSNGGIKTCRIHDLLRDLSVSEAKEDRFLDIHMNVDSASPTRARQLTIHGDIDRYISLNRPTPHIRSLLWITSRPFEKLLGKEHWRFWFTGFRLLRVLDLPRVAITKLPGEIGRMIHLRYLGLRGNLLHRLPSSIGNLANLQTLDLAGDGPLGPLGPHSIRLPSVISKLDQLRHLYMNWGKMTRRSRIDGLRSLQTLSLIEAGSWIEEGLAKLTNLRKLGIMGILSSHKEALSYSIAKLERLKYLVLATEYEGDNMMPTIKFSNHVDLYKLQLHGRLEKLPMVHEFPPNITYLSLAGSRLMEDPMATLEKLPQLRILKLLEETYMGKGMVCFTGGFSQLNELVLVDLLKLEEWSIEEGAMSSLRSLSISGCHSLRMLPEGLQHVTTLQKLELKWMPNNFKVRILPENVGEDWYKVQHVASIITHR